MRTRSAIIVSSVLAVFVGSVSHAVHAAAIAADDASDPAYSSGWTDGTNGGFGFTPWQLVGPGDLSQGGFYIGDSTTNGGSGSGSFGSSGGINTAGAAWGLYANNEQIADSRRQFTDGPLEPGQTFTVSFDNGWVDNDGTVGIALQNGVFNNRFEFYFHVGDPQYTINDASGPHFANFNWTDSGIVLQFTLLDADDYSLTLTPASGGLSVFDSGQLLNGTGTPDIDNVRAYNFDAGSDTPRDAFINSMSVGEMPEPEPASSSVAFFSGLLTIRRRI